MNIQKTTDLGAALSCERSSAQDQIRKKSKFEKERGKKKLNNKFRFFFNFTMYLYTCTSALVLYMIF